MTVWRSVNAKRRDGRLRRSRGTTGPPASSCTTSPTFLLFAEIVDEREFLLAQKALGLGQRTRSGGTAGSACPAPALCCAARLDHRLPRRSCRRFTSSDYVRQLHTGSDPGLRPESSR